MIKSLCCAVMIVSIWAPQGRAQNAQVFPRDLSEMGSMADRGFSSSPVAVDPARERLLFQAAQHQNAERQKALQQDTDKLLELATELKQHVDRTNANILSMDVVKKAQEIEKLAKSVKDKMKGD